MKAVTPFKKGEFVCEYVGQLIPFKEAKRREEEYSELGGAGCFMYHFWHKDKHFWLAISLLYYY